MSKAKKMFALSVYIYVCEKYLFVFVSESEEKLSALAEKERQRGGEEDKEEREEREEEEARNDSRMSRGERLTLIFSPRIYALRYANDQTRNQDDKGPSLMRGFHLSMSPKKLKLHAKHFATRSPAQLVRMMANKGCSFQLINVEKN